MKKKMKWILGGIVAIVIVLAALFQGSRPLEVKTLEVQPREIAKTFEEEGLVVTENEVLIAAPFSGKIEAIPVKEGDWVLAGELLAVLDSSALNFELEDLKGQLRSLKAQWETERSGIGLEKLKQLYEAGAISQKEYEDAKNRVESDYYPGQIASLEARIRSVEYRIEESSIKAPEEGIVSELSVKQGQVITAGNNIMKLFRDDSYLVEAYLLTEDAARLKSGMEVELILENKEGDTVFTGVVKSLAPTAVERISALGLREQRVKVTIKPLIPAGQVSLRPGYALDVRFTLNRQTDKLVVPKTALFPYREGEGIWVVEDGKARVRQVQRGFENEREVAIEEGLSAGELVLINPQQEGLKEGIKVRL